ncbi:DUF6093 family protein [Streptomyces celluloflavus]|uniref:DUF6093 family protein n=1 Tax=Streptomyces celluloflavus TaxID=58344 RepID=UPI0036B56158
MNHSVARLLAHGRAAAAALMTDVCRIERTRVTTTDDGQDVEQVEALYEGRCRIRPSPQAAVDDLTGTALVATWPYVVSVPLAVADVRAGDAVTVTTSDDPSLTGLRLRVRSIDRGTQITARRLGCEEVNR